jgi:hypothetical protein
VSQEPDIRPERVPKYSASSLAEYNRHAVLRAADAFTLALIYVFVGDRDDITPAAQLPTTMPTIASTSH